jgi:fumarylacetoacetate (FAA) hydrolase
MKLASLKHGRDGRLVVVSQDLNWFTDAFLIAPTLQAALDDWDRCGPRLQALAESLEHEAVPRGRFHERDAASPLPRAYQWADGSAYVNHVELVRKARGADMPESFWTDPLMYQGGSDGFLPPRDPIPLADPAWGCDLEAEIVVVVGDVPQGATRDRGPGRHPPGRPGQRREPAQPDPGRTGQGLRLRPVQARQRPVARLGHARCAGRPLEGRQAARRPVGAAERRGLRQGRRGRRHDLRLRDPDRPSGQDPLAGAGTIIGSGTVSNRDADGGPGKPVSPKAAWAIPASPRSARSRRSCAARPRRPS